MEMLCIRGRGRKFWDRGLLKILEDSQGRNGTMGEG